MRTSDPTAKNISHWEEIFSSRSWGKYPPEELIRFVARTFPIDEARQHLRVLEVGCGPGANIWYLVREGILVAGIDGSSHAIELANERLRRENLIDAGREPDLRVGNFAELPWADATFDAVVDVGGITSNTSKTIRAVFGEVHRVLKPGGFFFTMVFSPETSGTATGRMLEERTTENPAEGPLQGMGIIHVFTQEELRTGLAAFSDIRFDWLRRSDRGGKFIFAHWIVQARKLLSWVAIGHLTEIGEIVFDLAVVV